MFAPGDIFDQRYEVQEELGGNDGTTVFRATEMASGRDLVIRSLPEGTTGFPVGFRENFLAEAKRVSRLRSGSTVALEAYGVTDDGVLYLVCDFAAGAPLSSALAEEKMPPPEAFELVKRIAESLHEASERDVVHRQLSPHKIMVPPRRGALGAKLRDFGLTNTSTFEGPVTGTNADPDELRYMSPEQVLGEDITIESNIYSLGLIFYELLTGKPAIGGSTARELMAAHLSTTEIEVPAIVPGPLRPILQRMIAKKQRDRYPTTEELLADLNEIESRDLGATVNLRAEELIARINAAPDQPDTGATMVESWFRLDETSEQTLVRADEKTQEHLQGTLAEETEEATQITHMDEVTRVDAGPRTDEITEKEIVADDVTDLAERQSPPRDLGSMDNEPTDELAEDPPTREDKRRTRRSRDGESRHRGRAPHHTGRRRRPTPAPELPEDRVSGWVAIGAIAGAVALALLVTGLVLYLARSRGADESAVRAVVGSQQPTEIATDTTATNNPPAVDPNQVPSADAGTAAPADVGGAMATGCGVERETGWVESRQVVGLTSFTYDTYVPSSYNGTPSPAIVVAHPAGMPPKFFIKHVGLPQLAEELGAILLIPEDKSLRPWMRDVDNAMREFDRVIDHATGYYCLDMTKLFGVGMSGGAQALDRYSCANPDRFRGLGLVAHWVSQQAYCKERKSAMLMVAGLADQVSPAEGGGGCWGMDNRVPLDAAEAELVKQHGCGPPMTWAKETDGTCKGFKSCRSDFVMCRVPEGVHEWPGSRKALVGCPQFDPTPPTLTKFPATTVIQRFFRQQMAK